MKDGYLEFPRMDLIIFFLYSQCRQDNLGILFKFFLKLNSPSHYIKFRLGWDVIGVGFGHPPLPAKLVAPLTESVLHPQGNGTGRTYSCVKAKSPLETNFAIYSMNMIVLKV